MEWLLGELSAADEPAAVVDAAAMLRTLLSDPGSSAAARLKQLGIDPEQMITILTE